MSESGPVCFTEERIANWGVCFTVVSVSGRGHAVA
jgi:hypothetical protein